MSSDALNQILYKRLERIRDDLDAFLAEADIEQEEDHYCETQLVFDVVDEVKEKPKANNEHLKRSLVEKMIGIVHLNEDEEDADYSNDDYEIDEGLSSSKPQKSFGKGIPAELQPTSKASSEFSKSAPVPSQSEQKRLNLDKVLEQKAETFSSMLLRLIDEKNLKDSDVYKRANIDRRLFSKIRGDVDYLPSKKTAISFCLALQLNLQESKALLEKAGYALSEASRFDLIIIYLIQNAEFNIHFANIVLDDYGEGTLSQ